MQRAAQGKEGRTPLLLASAVGAEELITLLIAEGADVMHKDDRDFTALHHACNRGHDAACRALLDAGIEVNASDFKGRTALHHSCIAPSRNGRSDEWMADRLARQVLTARALLDGGADVNATDQSGWTPLFFVCKWLNDDLALLLIERGADWNAVDADGESARDVAQRLGNGHIVPAAKAAIVGSA